MRTYQAETDGGHRSAIRPGKFEAWMMDKEPGGRRPQHEAKRGSHEMEAAAENWP